MTFKKNCITLFFLLLFGYTQAQVSENMILLSNMDPTNIGYNDIWGYVDPTTQKEFAIIGAQNAIYFYDVTIPTAPVLVESFFPGGNTIWRDFKTYDHYCYAVVDNDSEGLLIFDLANIANAVNPSVSQIGGSYNPTTFFSAAHNIYIDEPNARLYAVGTNTRSNGVIILDLSNPETPSLMASRSLAIDNNTGGYVHDIYVKDHIGYCSHGPTSSFVVWDFRNPSNPTFKASLNSSGYNHSSWVTENNMYAIYAEEVGIGLPLGIVDLTDIDGGNIETIHTFKEPLLAPAHVNNRPHNPFVVGDHLFVSYYHDGLVVFDISDLASGTFDPNMTTRRIAHYDTYPSNNSYSGFSGAWGVYPFLPSGILLVSDGSTGLYVLQMGAVALTVELSSFDARLEKDKVNIQWATNSEENNDYFEVQRSKDAKDFRTIGRVQGAGTTSSFNNYNLVDKDPQIGANYYRLKQVDFDGKTHYSDQVQVNYNVFDLKLYPNYLTTTTEVKFVVHGLESSDATLLVSDLSGKIINLIEVEDIEDGIEMNISTTNLSNGMYVITLETDKGSIAQKLVIAR